MMRDMSRNGDEGLLTLSVTRALTNTTTNTWNRMNVTRNEMNYWCQPWSVWSSAPVQLEPKLELKAVEVVDSVRGGWFGRNQGDY